MSLPREDLDLVDALVWAGCLSRVAAREVAKGAAPGKVATFIAERGLAPMVSPPEVILARLRRLEELEQTVVNRAALSAGLERALEGLVDQAIAAEPYSPSVLSCVSCLQRDAAVGRGYCEACFDDNAQRGKD